MITKLASINHNKTSKIANIRIRGESLANSTPADGIGVSVTTTGLGVFVGVEVLVDAGNIKVIAGKGMSVTVGVSEGDGEVVYVSVGVLGVPVWVCVIKPVVTVAVTTAA